MIGEPVTRELCDYVDAVRETMPALERRALQSVGLCSVQFANAAVNDAAIMEYC